MDHAQPRRAARTRHALLSAGIDLLMDRSVDAIPIDDLVDAANVGKGSFYNHFGDRDGFKSAIALQIREEVEAQIGAANAQVTNELERLAGGMRELTNYALTNRKRTVAMLRMTVGATTRDYPLNEGIVADIEACAKAGLIQIRSTQGAVLYWLGLSVVLVTQVIENDLSRPSAAKGLHEMLTLGLTGLNAAKEDIGFIADRCAAQLKSNA